MLLGRSSRTDSLRMSRVAAAILLGCSAAAGTAPVAHADPTTSLHCEGYFSTTYDPPLTNTPTQTDVAFHNDLDYCPVGGVSGGDASGHFTAIRSCTTLDLPPHPATVTYEWENGTSSTVAFSYSTVDRLINGTTAVTSYGTVTTGFHHGANAVHTAIQPQLDPPACAGSGVAHTTGPEQLTFTD